MLFAVTVREELCAFVHLVMYYYMMAKDLNFSLSHTFFVGFSAEPYKWYGGAPAKYIWIHVSL